MKHLARLVIPALLLILSAIVAIADIASAWSPLRIALEWAGRHGQEGWAAASFLAALLLALLTEGREWLATDQNRRDAKRSREHRSDLSLMEKRLNGLASGLVGRARIERHEVDSVFSTQAVQEISELVEALGEPEPIYDRKLRKESRKVSDAAKAYLNRLHEWMDGSEATGTWSLMLTPARSPENDAERERRIKELGRLRVQFIRALHALDTRLHEMGVEVIPD